VVSIPQRDHHHQQDNKKGPPSFSLIPLCHWSNSLSESFQTFPFKLPRYILRRPPPLHHYNSRCLSHAYDIYYILDSTPFKIQITLHPQWPQHPDSHIFRRVIRTIRPISSRELRVRSSNLQAMYCISRSKCVFPDLGLRGDLHSVQIIWPCNVQSQAKR